MPVLVELRELLTQVAAVVVVQKQVTSMVLAAVQEL
jgi:hypothetical protein